MRVAPGFSHAIGRSRQWRREARANKAVGSMARLIRYAVNRFARQIEFCARSRSPMGDETKVRCAAIASRAVSLSLHGEGTQKRFL